MSCFDNLFTLKLKELKEVVQRYNSNLKLSGLNKSQLLCLIMKLKNTRHSDNYVLDRKDLSCFNDYTKLTIKDLKKEIIKYVPNMKITGLKKSELLCILFDFFYKKKMIKEKEYTISEEKKKRGAISTKEELDEHRAKQKKEHENFLKNFRSSVDEKLYQKIKKELEDEEKAKALKEEKLKVIREEEARLKALKEEEERLKALKEEEPEIKPIKKQPIENKQRDEFLKDVIEILGKLTGKVSQRVISQFNNKHKSGKDMIYDLIGARDFGFFPTPTHCLENNKRVVGLLKEAENILEPTCGIGNMINYAHKINPEAKIVGIEFLPKIYEIAKSLFPEDNIKILHKNFLEMKVEENEIDTILMNPPFANRNDKLFYMDFIFKSLSVMRQSDRHLCDMIVICPEIRMNKDVKNYHSFNTLNLIQDSNLSYNKFSSIYENITGSKLSKSDYKDIENNSLLWSYIGYDVEWEEIGDCTDFGGTGVKTKIYLFRQVKFSY